MYPTEFLDDYFIDYKNKMESFSLHLQRNMKVVVEYMKEYDLKFNELFECEGINHPPILKLLLGDDISLETFTVLDICLDFTKVLNDKLILRQEKLVIQIVRVQNKYDNQLMI
jgi:hypothetical protein